MTKPYPDAVAGPYDPPPRTFADATGREIRVERLTPESVAVEDVVEMYLAFDPEDRAQGIPPTTEGRIYDWLDAILGEDCLNVVAWYVDADRVVGHATLVPDGEGAFELAIFVLAEFQGAGIGTELLEALLGLGRGAGVERVWLTVERWNAPAIRLYEKVGFEPVDAGGFEKEMTARLH